MHAPAIVSALRNIRGRALDLISGRFAISLAARIVSRANLVLLLAQVIAALISPVAGLFTCLACPLFDGIAAIFGYFTNLLA